MSSRKSLRSSSKLYRDAASSSLAIFLLVCAVFACAPYRAYAVENKFSPERWRQAVDAKNPNWSREALLEPLVTQYKLIGMDRARVLSLLGEPGFSQEHEPQGQYRSRRDLYCLSAKDDKSFSIDYDGGDKVKSYVVESRPCRNCSLFIGPAPATNKYLKPAVLNKLLLQKYTGEQIREMDVGRLESMLGKADRRRTVDRRAGGQIWVDVDYTWRLSANGTKLFVIDGRSVPKGNWRPNQDPKVSSWWLIAMARDCQVIAQQGSNSPGRELELRRLEEKLRRNSAPRETSNQAP